MATLSEPTLPSMGRYGDRVAGVERRRGQAAIFVADHEAHVAGEGELVQRARPVGELEADRRETVGPCARERVGDGVGTVAT